MFGFSIGKLLVTGIAILVVWYGFKLLARDGKDSKMTSREAAKPENLGVNAEELVECGVCQAYAASATASDCGRSGCPYPA